MLVSPGVVLPARAMRNSALDGPLGVFAREKAIDQARAE